MTIDHSPERIRTLETAPTRIDAGLPLDEVLPAFAALRARGLRAIDGFDCDDRPAQLILRGYTPGDRGAIEVRLPDPGGCRFALKIYANDAAPEAALYRALSAAGLTTERGVRVPRLVAWDRSLNVLVLEWLDGSPLNEVAKDDPGRAGELAARWVNVAATLPLRLGPAQDAARVLAESGRFLDMLEVGDADLGASGRAVIEALAQCQPPRRSVHLVHGTLYTRHLIDTGAADGDDGGPGIIDWQRFGQGPLELDAGTFLATLWRSGLLRRRRVRDVEQVEGAFRARTGGLLDERALAWHQAAALLRLAGRMLRRRSPEKAAPLLSRAGQLAEAAQ
jgi:phosphotransferase family enzyme